MTTQIVGVDEVGRGALIGPVIAAAVVAFNDQAVAPGVGDSKQISRLRREKISLDIRRSAIDWSIAGATAREIDDINIHNASLLAMRRAVLSLREKADFAYVDGKYLPDIPMPGQPIVKGDQKISVVSAASILAKVFRDQYMTWLSQVYPGYGLEKNKGYPTTFHRLMLGSLGATPQHRRSFSGVLESGNKQHNLKDNPSDIKGIPEP